MNPSALFTGSWLALVGAFAAGFSAASVRAETAVPAIVRADDLNGALGRLSSASAAERALAQRWLAAHLGSGDFAAVASAVRSGDAEARARVVEALAGEDRLLALAA